MQGGTLPLAAQAQGCRGSVLPCREPVGAGRKGAESFLRCDPKRCVPASNGRSCKTIADMLPHHAGAGGGKECATL
ncbi:hypothetical protein D7X33_21570 [Butyricicoccus sp. 1XD8-22]|nr:hypothetical protein D7X33_21570 [Butyricicoccus sp. 1XD8-22]